MIDYGAKPAQDEIEVVLFGPGYGEAIAVHLGGDRWLLVDSCVDPLAGLPASEHYLNSIGVDPSCVLTIVASHWHDDHVRGISRLAEAFPDADFMLSSVFNNREAAYFLAGYGGTAAPGQAKGGLELFKAIERRDNVYYIHQHSNVFSISVSGKAVNAMAFSPVHGAVGQSLAHMAQYLPGFGKPINHAPDLEPNLEAVVIHIDLGDDAILLGSDLLEDAARGWAAVVADRRCSARRTASAYKVAHHGSHSGENASIWATLLCAEPVACMTPFNNGNQRLPTDADKARISSYTSKRYITSGSSRRPNMDSAQRKRLEDICKNLSPVNPGFGAVRLRRKYGAPAWDVECLGNAQAL